MASTTLLLLFALFPCANLYVGPYYDDFNCSALDIRQFFDYPLEYIKLCAFQYKNLNLECVVQSCPSLSTSKLCPFDSKGQVQEKDFNKGLDLIKKCLKQSTSICGANATAYQFQNIKIGLLVTAGEEQRLVGDLLLSSGQILMPWLNNDFAVVSDDNNNKNYLSFDITATINFQTLIDCNPFSYYYRVKTPNGFSKFDKVAIHTHFKSLPLNFTDKRTSLMELILPTSSTPSSTPTVKQHEEYYDFNTIQAGEIHGKKWTQQQTALVNEKFLKAMAKNFRGPLVKKHAMPLFITTYIGYAFMEIDSRCPSLLGQVEKVVNGLAEGVSGALNSIG